MTEAIVTGDNYDNRPAGEQRLGNWMQTYSGRMFWPLDPRPDEVEIEDIAHALSNACRFAGHCDRFYSVAEHSVLVSRVVPREHQLTALLHDATEAYCSDVVRPIKPHLQGYQAVEARLWAAIAARFRLPEALPDCVKHADNAVLLAEQRQIMKAPPAAWNVPGEPAAVQVLGLDPYAARQLFLRRFAWLDGRGA